MQKNMMKYPQTILVISMIIVGAIITKNPMIIILIIIGISFALIIGKSQRKHIPALPNDATEEDIISLVTQGKNIHAMKWYRELTGASLKEAKQHIDSIRKNLKNEENA